MKHNHIGKIFAISFILFILGVFVPPLFSFAQTTQTVSPIMPNIWTGGYWGPLVSCRGLGCLSLCDLFQTLEYILAFGQTIAIYIAAPVLFVWGGIIIMTAGANPANIQKGRKILTGTLIGVLIVIFAYFIIATIVNTLIPGLGRYIGGFSSGNPFTCTVNFNPNPSGGVGIQPGGNNGYSNGTNCAYDWECQSNYCDPISNSCKAAGGGGTTGYSNGTNCAYDWECQSNYCDPISNSCKAAGGGGATIYPNGTSCSSNSVCQSNYCDPNTNTCQTPGTGFGLQNGASCSFNWECQSNVCDPASNTCQ